MGYAVKENGSFRAVDDESWCADDEVYQDEQPASPGIDPQIEINNQARLYLSQTDWYVIRQQETGEHVPDGVIAERAAARARVVE